MLNTKRLRELQGIVKIHAVATKAGLNAKCVQVKLHRGTELTESESRKIGRVLTEFGFSVRKK